MKKKRHKTSLDKNSQKVEDKIEKQIKKVEKEIEKEIILNVPNSITLLRLVLIFVFIYMLFEHYSKIWLFIIFSIAAITDWFDGYFARKLKQTTKFGGKLDQIVDRIFTLMIVFAIVFFIVSREDIYSRVFSFSSKNILLLLFLSISREIIGFPAFLIALMRKKQSYHVKYIGKVTTTIQSITIAAIIIGSSASIYLAMATCIIGIISGFSYLKYALS